jgi:hypothetical protein
MNDIIPIIATYGNCYTAIIRTCKQFHWLPVDDSSIAAVYRTFARWRLPNKHFQEPIKWYTCSTHATNPEAAYSKGNTPVGNPYYLERGEIIYALGCRGDKNGLTEYQLKSGTSEGYHIESLKIIIFGNIHCCRGNVNRCKHSSILAAALGEI